MITKEQGLTLRGLAIMSIALHNFLHQKQFGLAQENEMHFDANNINILIEHLTSGGVGIIGELFSFLGWSGVPVFVFLSGYGLAKKYPNGVQTSIKWDYVLHSYLKLLLLLIPAALLFMVIHALQGYWVRVGLDLFSLTFLNNLVSYFRDIPSAAPPFWYFAMTMQLYIAFLLVGNISKKMLFVIGGFVVAILFIVTPDMLLLIRYIRVNCVAWLPIFFIGIICGRWNIKDIKSILSFNCLLIISLLSLVIMIVVNSNFYFWVMMPFFSLAFFISSALIMDNNKLVSAITIYLGKISAYIFVTHHIAIFIFQHITHQYPLWLTTIVFVSLILLFSEGYKIIHHSLIKILQSK